MNARSSIAARSAKPSLVGPSSSSTLASLALLGAIAACGVSACGDDADAIYLAPKDGGIDADGDRADAAAPACAAAPAAEVRQGACEVTLQSHPIQGDAHLPEGRAIAYCSNPPSSGPHYPVWADYRDYAAPIEWPYLVHSMEHGAVILLYKCEAGGCPEVVDQLRAVRDGAAPDPICAAGTKRIILVPSPTIPTKVAAASWGKTYLADCVDVPTLEAFVRDNIGKGTEPLCNAGRSF